MLTGHGMAFIAPIPSSRYLSDDGRFSVEPRYARSRNGRRRLKSVVYHLHEHGRMIGKPFESVWLAREFAEALAALGDDRRARAEFIRNGGEWCYDRYWQRQRERRKREDETWLAGQRAHETGGESC